MGIIGGLVASSSELDHTGALVASDAGTEPILICTATLIGPSTVVTAKHCLRETWVQRQLGLDVSWARGVNIAEAQLVAVATTSSPDSSVEGALGLGYDVGIAHLLEDVPASPAMAVPWDAELLDTSLVTIGYGMATAWGPTGGMRRIGRETVVASEGALYEILYGDFESFVEVELTGASTDQDYLGDAKLRPLPDELDVMHRVYTQKSLIAEHEIVTRPGFGGTRSCRGDSGSPLLSVREDGGWAVHGVLSGGAGSARAECDFGEVYAVFGPATFPFIQDAVNE